MLTVARQPDAWLLTHSSGFKTSAVGQRRPPTYRGATYEPLYKASDLFDKAPDTELARNKVSIHLFQTLYDELAEEEQDSVDALLETLITSLKS